MKVTKALAITLQLLLKSRDTLLTSNRENQMIGFCRRMNCAVLSKLVTQQYELSLKR
jgi:hypothetical protein